jgi:ABC-2 type transport system ATP-binding protein
MNYVIETEELTKHYGMLFWRRKEAALDRLTMAIPESVVFGFLGPNGAGKTTTIRLLMDLIRPTGGRAMILGRPPDDLETKRHIGFLPDSPAFNPYLSAYEFLVICAKLLRIGGDQRRQRIDEVLETVRMTKHARSKLGGFSRGMLQRIGIAQAILNRPRLMILDEPLVGLDPHGRQELKEIILRQKASGTNVFFSSHILSDVEKICSHIGILNQGQLLCYGALDELLSVTGMRVHVHPGHQDLVGRLMPEATGSIRLPDGGWELVFPTIGGLRERIGDMQREHPEAINIAPSRESLEDFFFRKIENQRAIS